MLGKSAKTLTAASIILAALPFASAPASAGSPPTYIGGPGGAKYFVVVGTFKSKKKARKRNKMFGDTFIDRTNRYPNMKKGYWIVMEGPYSKQYAKSIACSEAVHDCFVKAGW